MPAFLEKQLKDEYGANSSIPYKIMNSKGYMHGSKETAAGSALQAKHDADMKKKGMVRSKLHSMLMGEK